MIKHTDGTRSTATSDNQDSVERDSLSTERHPVDDFTISPRLYGGEDREFGRIANPDARIIIDAAGSFTRHRVSWADGEKPSDVYVAAFIPAQRWYGWAKPYFPQSECLRLAHTQSTFNGSLRFEYDPVREVWQEFNDEEGYREDCPWIVIGGEVCHQVGSGFTWMELPDKPQRPEPETSGLAAREVLSAAGATKGRSIPLPAEPVNSLAITGTVDTGYGPWSL